LRRLLLFVFLALLSPCVIAQHQSGQETKAEQEGEALWMDRPTLWKSANFAILIALMGYGIAKTAGPFFASRTSGIQKGIQEATRLRDEAEARLAEMEERMANLEEDIAALRERAAAEAAAESERIKNETAQLLEKVRADAEYEIALAVKQARKKLRAYSAELSLNLASRKIRERLTPDREQDLVDNVILNLPRRVN
jgi:F-type H+-transporting ATPase subunit b